MSDKPADYWIQHLKLEKHPEGGYYARVYSSDLHLKQTSLPPGFHGDRPLGTHIYYLLKQNEFSAFHRIQSDELWHFYYGDALKIYELEKNGSLTEHLLGTQIENGQSPFCLIKAFNWFAAELLPGSDFALVGCTVVPGFDFAEFAIAEREKLALQFPEHTELIERLTK